MPGLNQKGPEGKGPMTGRRQGNCLNAGMGRRGCRRGDAGQGLGRGYGAGTAERTRDRASLQDRARILEDELAAVNDQLNAMPDND